MIRFNYHQTSYERLLGGVDLARVASQLRVPIATLGAALLAVAGTWTFEMHRIAVLDGELASLRLRAQAAAVDVHRAERLNASVTRLQAVRARIAAARREVIVATNTIAQIGNALPPQTWLTEVGSNPSGTWTIGGRSTQVDEIGTMLRRVQELDRNAAARIVSIAATGRGGRVLDFVIGWQPGT